MRIVSGSCRGRIINPPKNLKARPTTDFAKENIFNVLANIYNFENVKVLDIFSGTGSISFEFASRGAYSVTSVELNAVHHKFIENTAKELKLNQIRAIKSNAFVFLKSIKDSYDIIFADPPYDLEGVETIPDIVLEKSLLTDEGVLILEHSKDKDFSSHPHFWQHKSYGSVNFSMFLKDTQ